MLSFNYKKQINNSFLGVVGHVQEFDTDFTDIYEYIKNLRGDYSVVYDTEEFLYLATNPLRSKTLYFSGNAYYNLPSKTSNKVYPVPANTVLKINKKNECVESYSTIHKWDNTKTNNNLDKIFEKFLEVCPSNLSDITMSSGIDTGCLLAVADPKSKAHAILDDEDISVLAKRIKAFDNYIIYKHEFKKVDYSIFTKNNVVSSRLAEEESGLLGTWVKIFNEVDDKLLMGLGGDQLYRGKNYPKLEEMVDWFECVSVYCGKQIINPLMDHNLYQLYLNTNNADNWQEKFIETRN